MKIEYQDGTTDVRGQEFCKHEISEQETEYHKETRQYSVL